MSISKKNVDRFSDCWLFLHAWTYGETTWTPRLDYGIPVTLVCTRCGTERRETWSIGGARMTRRYVYPEGYSLAERVTGVPRPTLDDLRAMVLAERRLRLRALGNRKLRAVQ
jgi:hypothetical protein